MTRHAAPLARDDRKSIIALSSLAFLACCVVTGYHLVHQPFAHSFESYLPPRIIVFRIGSRCAEERWPNDAVRMLATVSVARWWPPQAVIDELLPTGTKLPIGTYKAYELLNELF